MKTKNIFLSLVLLSCIFLMAFYSPNTVTKTHQAGTCCITGTVVFPSGCKCSDCTATFSNGSGILCSTPVSGGTFTCCGLDVDSAFKVTVTCATGGCSGSKSNVGCGGPAPVITLVCP